MTAKNDFEHASPSSASTAIITTSSIADGNFSVGETNASVTEINNSGNWPAHKVWFSGSFTGAPAVGAGLNLFLVETEVDGAATHDETMPALADDNGAEFRHRIALNDATGQQYRSFVIPTMHLRKFKLAFEVDTVGAAVSLNSGAILAVEGCSLEDV